MVTKSGGGLSGDHAPSRRQVVAGIGFAGLFASVGAALLRATPAEALVNAPVMKPEAAQAQAQAQPADFHAEEKLANLDASQSVEFTARRRRRYWRRTWRRRGWRRGYRRVVCRRRLIRGRVVRVCRHLW